MFTNTEEEHNFLKAGIVGIVYEVSHKDIQEYDKGTTNYCTSKYLVDTCFKNAKRRRMSRYGFNYSPVTVVCDSLKGDDTLDFYATVLTVDGIRVDLSNYKLILMMMTINDASVLRESFLNLGKGERHIYLMTNVSLQDLFDILSVYNNNELYLHLTTASLANLYNSTLEKNIGLLFSIKKAVGKLNIRGIGGDTIYNHNQSPSLLIGNYTKWIVGDVELLSKSTLKTVHKCCEKNASSKEEAKAWELSILGSFSH